MAPLQMALMFVLVVGVPSSIGVANVNFLCNSQIKESAQSNAPISAIYSGVFSHLACGLLCKTSSSSCVAFNYTSAGHCYLYKDSVLPVLSKDRITCQLASYVPTTTIAASTVPSLLVNCPTTLTTFTNIGDICPRLANCTCNKVLNAVFLFIPTADLCYNKCATTANCLAFSSLGSYCSLATDQTALTLYSSVNSLTGYC